MKKELAKKYLEEVRAGYDKYAEEFSRRHTKLPGDILELFGKFIKTGDKLLDLGCGDGRLVNLIKDKRIEYIGIDNSEELIKQARKKFSIFPPSGDHPQGDNFQFSNNYQLSIINYQVADVLSLPFEDESFDVVFCGAVLHHLPTKELRIEALREMQRVLKPGGVLILTNWYLLREVWDFGRIVTLLHCYIVRRKECPGFKDLLIPWGITGRKAKRYYYAFSLAELKKLVKRIGFKVDEAYYTDRKKKSSWWRSFWKRGNVVVVAEKR